MGLSWLLLTVGVGAQPTEFQISTDTPDALCPELSITRDAVKKRLGQLEVEGGGIWRGQYSTVHDPAGRRGDYVRLVIIDPTGKEQSARELPMQGESCSTMAQAIALVVDGFFRDLGQSALREAAPPDSAARQAKPARAPSRNAAAVAAEPTNAPAGPAAPLATPVATPLEPARAEGSSAKARGEPRSSQSSAAKPRTEPRKSGGKSGVVTGVGYESVPSSAAFVLGCFVAVTPGLRLELKGALSASRVNRQYGRATTHLYPVPLRLALTYVAPRAGNLEWFLGPETLVSFERGSTSGLSNGNSGWRASFGLGAKAGAAYWVLPWFAIAATLSADAVLVRSRRFLIEDEPMAESSRARLAGALELWGAIFP